MENLTMKMTAEQIDDIVTAYIELKEVFYVAEKIGCIDINGKTFAVTNTTQLAEIMNN